jgi:hypothetical protein
LPEKSNKYEKFYEKARNPENFKVGVCCDRDNYDHKKEKLKVYVQSRFNIGSSILQTVAELSNTNIELTET